MMTCPHCNYDWSMLAANAMSIPDVAPIICENCAEISLLFGGAYMRKATLSELEAIRQSPAWDFISRSLTVIRAHIKARKARYN